MSGIVNDDGIRLTRMKKAGRALLSKRITLGEDGRPVSDGSPCAMARGAATRVTLDWWSPATDLAALILDLGPHEALVLGDHVAAGRHHRDRQDGARRRRRVLRPQARDVQVQGRRAGGRPARLRSEGHLGEGPRAPRGARRIRGRDRIPDPQLPQLGPGHPGVDVGRSAQRGDGRDLPRQRRAARLPLRPRRRRHPAVSPRPAEACMAGRPGLDHGVEPRRAPGPQHRRCHRRQPRATRLRRHAEGRGAAGAGPGCPAPDRP